MRIVFCQEGHENTFQSDKEQLVVGRPSKGAPVDLDLSPDDAVSRQHARISVENCEYWIEDLGSTRGTMVNGQEIKGQGRYRLAVGATIQVGKTEMRILSDKPAAGVSQPTDHGFRLKDRGVENPRTPRSPNLADPVPESLHRLDANLAPVFPKGVSTGRDARFLLFELPLEFVREARLESLFETIVKCVVKVIPGAKRGAILLIERPAGRLLLKAHYPDGEFVVSTTMAQRTIQTREAFAWQQSLAPNAVDAKAAPRSILERRVEAVMYAPLLWQGEVLGVLCVDSGEDRASFGNEELQLLVAVAQYSAMAVANGQLQEALKAESALRANLMRQFSPKIAQELLNRRGRLRLGGERSEVTILCSDIRGFTRLSQRMEPDDVVELLNDCFSRLVPVVFAHDGTVDKYIGDAVLAVFGSPEPDVEQHEKAVRAAMEMQAAMQKLNADRARRGLVTCEIGVGVHCGEVVHGFIGTGERMEYTLIGDAVNRASRYCDGARAGEVLISPELHQRVWQVVESLRVSIPTKHEGELPAYRVSSLKDVRQSARPSPSS